MASPEDKPITQPAAAKPPRTRTRGKGAPPSHGDTLGALRAERASADDKPRAKREKVGEKKAKATKVAGKAPGKAQVRAPDKSRTEPLNFRVTPDFRRAFKRAAAAQDCKKVELLERIFTEWSARNPA
ncbi:hypothetical protein [Falsiroseomonas sp.]|uniref:hypothetical protein n=1 Tax=Falsiroseomonas sp. TaxID=2870721 RepID=UPI0034A2697D